VRLRVPGLCCGLMILSGAARAADDFHASVGPGIYAGPSFPGSRHERRLVFPFVDAEYAGRVYTSANDLIGVYAYQSSRTQLGAAVEYDLTERRVPGFPNVKETPRFKLFGSQTVSAFTADANVARDIGGHGEGTLAQANLWVTVPFDTSFSVSVGPGVTWADSRYMHTLYAVTAAEAADSSLPVFASRAGVPDLHVNGLTEWVIHSKYRIGAQAWLWHLRGAAASSPLAAQRVQTTVIGWIAYRFN
jgi:outer membrane protein